MTITQSAVLMFFGALVAIAGLALLYFRKEQAENKIKVFGQEFEISTPALVVFLAGCAIFILPSVIHIQNDPLVSFRWGAGSPATNQTTLHSGTLAAGYEIRYRNVVYRILDIHFDDYAPNELSLKIKVRMTATGSIPELFSGNSFRLLVDGVPHAPRNDLSEVVESHSAKEGTVEFVIPNVATALALRAGNVDDDAPSIPIAR